MFGRGTSLEELRRENATLESERSSFKWNVKPLKDYSKSGSSHEHEGSIWQQFEEDVSDVGYDEDEVDKVVDKYVKRLVHGRGGWTTAGARKSLRKRLKKMKEEEGW